MKWVIVGIGLFVASGWMAILGMGGCSGAGAAEVRGGAASRSSESAITFDLGDGINMRFVRIPAGEFMMGTPATEPGRRGTERLHKVRISKPFCMQTTHVTRGQFAMFVKQTGYKTDAETGAGGIEGAIITVAGKEFKLDPDGSWRNPGFPQTDEHPVVCMTWNDAMAFAQWLSKKQGKTFRLPTEAEWEYACRAGTSIAYFWGDDADGGRGYANVADQTGKKEFPSWRDCFNFDDGYVYTSPVASFKPNAWGLYDMIGNAWQWCADVQAIYPDAAVAVDPTGPADGEWRVARGGAWYTWPSACRSGCRSAGRPSSQPTNGMGFRLVMELK